MSPTITDSINDRVTVSLPDLFKGFLVGEPKVNPHYEAVRAESEAWLQTSLGLSAKESKRVHLCDFSYLVAVFIPHAPKEKLRVACDYGNWIFILDDMFDDGVLRDDPEASQRMILNLLAEMVPHVERFGEEPVVTAHDSIYRRIAADSSAAIRQRYVYAKEGYCAGALKHVEDFTADRTPTLLQMLTTRRLSIGVFPMYPLFEFAYSLSLPDEVFLHPAVQKLETLGAEFVLLMNDIVSYRKEETLDCPFNMVAVCRMNGAPAQKAFDEIASMIDARFGLWNESIKVLPSWGEEVNSQIRLYVQGIQNIVQANLSWSFRTGRYFGQQADTVQRCREIDVLVEPPFLSVGGNLESSQDTSGTAPRAYRFGDSIFRFGKCLTTCQCRA